MTIKSFLFFSYAWLCFWLLPLAADVGTEEGPNYPWFTGPLLTPPANVTKIGHYDIEPYFFWIVDTAEYDNHWHPDSIPKFYQYSPQLLFWIGLSEKVDFNGIIRSYYSRTQGESDWAFGDLTLGIDIQLWDDEKDTNFPGCQLTLQGLFPTGKYDKLNAQKKLTDNGGQGAFGGIIGLTFGKQLQISEDRYLGLALNFVENFFAPTVVHGFNYYGGDETTSGKVFPGNVFSIFFGAEYSLTRNWVFALDVVSQFYGKSRFSGNTVTFVGLPPASLFSLAPALEYNWNQHYGIIVGSWFSAAGRNVDRFYSVVAAFNIEY